MIHVWGDRHVCPVLNIQCIHVSNFTLWPTNIFNVFDFGTQRARTLPWYKSALEFLEWDKRGGSRRKKTSSPSFLPLSSFLSFLAYSPTLPLLPPSPFPPSFSSFPPSLPLFLPPSFLYFLSWKPSANPTVGLPGHALIATGEKLSYLYFKMNHFTSALDPELSADVPWQQGLQTVSFHRLRDKSKLSREDENHMKFNFPIRGVATCSPVSPRLL